MAVKVNVVQSPLKVRVGQTDAIKILTSNAGKTTAAQETSKNVIGGIADVTQLNVSGVSTLSGITSVTGSTLFAKQLNVSGVSTFAGTITGTATTALSLSGIPNINVGAINASSLNISGLTTLTGIVTTIGDLHVGGDLFVGDDIVFDEVTGRNLNITGIGTMNTLNVTGTLNAGLIDGGSF